MRHPAATIIVVAILLAGCSPQPTPTAIGSPAVATSTSTPTPALATQAPVSPRPSTEIAMGLTSAGGDAPNGLPGAVWWRPVP